LNATRDIKLKGYFLSFLFIGYEMIMKCIDKIQNLIISTEQGLPENN